MKPLISLACLAFAATAFPADWPQWRGPNGNGISSAKDLPVEWTDDKNIAWKTALPAWSGATPIVIGGRVFVMSPSRQPKIAEPEPATQAPANGQRRNRGGSPQRRGPQATVSGPGGDELLLICLSRTDGSELWRTQIDTGNELKRKQNNSSPSPVSDGKLVWATTGNGIVSAYSMEGELVWKIDLQKQYGSFGLNWGYASSPLL